VNRRPSFSYHRSYIDSIERTPTPQAARGALPAVSRSGAGPHMYAQNAGVGSSRLPFEITMPTGSTLILSSLCASLVAAIDHPSLFDPRHGRSDGPQSSVCATSPDGANTISDSYLHKKRPSSTEDHRRGMTRRQDWPLCRNATRLPSARGRSRRCIPCPDRRAPL